MNAEQAEPLTLRRCALLGAVLVLIAALRIVSTYTALSHTVDEPIHLGAGMEWLDHGTMTGDVSHPPMPRVLSAIGPWLAGEHWVPAGNTLLDGAAILGHGAHYDRMLALARLGILPLFLLACIMVFLWGNRTGGPLAGLIATFLFTTIPPVLAHAGLVTTDMAATAFTAAGAYAAILWAERPDPWRTVALGVAVGLGMIAKYSLLVFLPAIFAAMYLCQWRGMRAIPAQLREHWRPAIAAHAMNCMPCGLTVDWRAGEATIHPSLRRYWLNLLAGARAACSSPARRIPVCLPWRQMRLLERASRSSTVARRPSSCAGGRRGYGGCRWRRCIRT